MSKFLLSLLISFGFGFAASAHAQGFEIICDYPQGIDFLLKITSDGASTEATVSWNAGDLTTSGEGYAKYTGLKIGSDSILKDGAYTSLHIFKAPLRAGADSPFSVTLSMDKNGGWSGPVYAVDNQGNVDDKQQPGVLSAEASQNNHCRYLSK